MQLPYVCMYIHMFTHVAVCCHSSGTLKDVCMYVCTECMHVTICVQSDYACMCMHALLHMYVNVQLQQLTICFAVQCSLLERVCTCVCMYAFTHTYIDVGMFVYVQFMHAGINAYIHAIICMCMHCYIRMYIRACMHAYINTHAYVFYYAWLCIQLSMYMFAYAYVLMHINTLCRSNQLVAIQLASYLYAKHVLLTLLCVK